MRNPPERGSAKRDSAAESTERPATIPAMSPTSLKNKRRLIVLALYGLLTLLVFAAAWHRYALLDAAMPVRLARAAAAAVYLNSALILLPMLRFVLSVRALRKVAGVLPLHYAIEAHIIVGSALAIFSALHVAAYVVLYGGNGRPWWETITSRPANETGIALALLLAALMAGTGFRRSSRFENFYLSHFLGIPFIALCFWHAPRFAPWVALPLAIYLGDRFIRFFWMTRPAILTTIEHTADDTHLVLTRPAAFAYEAGDYAFLCVPQISRLEWHPFSLINAPASQGNLSFRIRRYGSWTQGLAQLQVGARIHIDGPFASPSRELVDSHDCVIVASGIGITPFISFFNELADRATLAHRTIVLYWLERDAANFAPFLPLLAKVQARWPDVVRLHLLAGSGSSAESLAQPFVVRRKVDWHAEFRALDAANGRALPMKVFFCGNRLMSAELRKACAPYRFAFRTESF